MTNLRSDLASPNAHDSSATLVQFLTARFYYIPDALRDKPHGHFHKPRALRNKPALRFYTPDALRDLPDAHFLLPEKAFYFCRKFVRVRFLRFTLIPPILILLL